MRTDNYQWTINYEGGTPITGTFLDGTPWIVPNGATLTLVAVSPKEETVTTAQGTGLVQRTVINPDFNKLFREETIRGVSFGDSFTVLTCVGSTAPDLTNRIPFDFRGGVARGSEESTVGRFYDATQGITQTNGIVSGITLEVGDMIITQTAFTGDFDAEYEADKPWTESWGCVTVLGSQPPSNAFRPPINWDPEDKANRPVLTEVDTFSDDQLTYPDYDFSSDTKTWTETNICYSPALERRLGTIAPNFVGGTDNAGFRGTIKAQYLTHREYGGYQAIAEERMMICCFDPNVSGATQDIFRRTITQRGIDTWGAMYSTGKRHSHNGYHGGEWNPRVYFAYAVTRDSRIFDVMDFTFGNTGNGTYKEFIKEKPLGLGRTIGYHETEQASVGHPLCSYRHFDMNVLESGLSGGVPYVVVERPTGSYHLNVYEGNPAGSWWGWSNNHRVPVPSYLIGSFIRTKGTGGGITRIIDGGGVSGSTLNPDSMVFYLQEDVVGGGANGITGCDLSNALAETRAETLVRTITYEESNTGSPAGPYAYTYSVMSHILSNWLISKAIGFGNLPKWGELQKEKAEILVTTAAGKNILANNLNVVYNLGLNNPSLNTLYHALCRQEIAAGVSLDAAIKEFDVTNNSLWRDPANWYDMPATRTWEELQVIPNIDQCVATTPQSSNNSGPYYIIGTGEVIGDPQWTVLRPRGDGSEYEIFLNKSSGMTWDYFTGKVHMWIRGATFAVGLTLDSTTATGTGDIDWNATWVLEEKYYPFGSLIPASSGVTIIWER